MGTFKASNFSNSDLSSLALQLKNEIESTCQDVLKIGNYSIL